MIITVDELNNYLNNYESDENITALKEQIILSAEDIVKDYLGYDPLCGYHEMEHHIGIGKRELYLNSKHIKNVEGLFIDGQFVCDYTVAGNHLYRKEGFGSGSDILVNYTSGWRPNELPRIIKTTVMRIATLLWTETSGNIGLSSRVSPDNSKTFLNYTNYSKYLAPLETYRIVRF